MDARSIRYEFGHGDTPEDEDVRCPVGVFRVWPPSARHPKGVRELWSPWAYVDVHAASEKERAEQLRRLDAVTACLKELWENDPEEPRNHAEWEAKRNAKTPRSSMRAQQRDAFRRQDSGTVSAAGVGLMVLGAVGIAALARAAARRRV